MIGAARDALEPLGPYVEDSEVFEEDDFYPEALDAFRWGGELTCLPQNISSLIVYYNRDLFKRFGVPPPTDGMRWNELVFRAQRAWLHGAVQEAESLYNTTTGTYPDDVEAWFHLGDLLFHSNPFRTKAASRLSPMLKNPTASICAIDSSVG